MPITKTEVFTAEQQMAWHGLLRSHAQVTGRIEADLMTRHQLSLGAVEVLYFLWVTPDPQPVRVIASQLITISPTRTSRVVQDLVDAGYLQRGSDQGDGRVSLISLTPTGAQFAGSVIATLQDSVRRHFLSLLDDEDLAGLRRIWSKLEAAQTAG